MHAPDELARRGGVVVTAPGPGGVPPRAHHAVVIGAGISGLRIAHLLGDAGLDVVVLEARSRVGGRLLSVATENGALDLGASWFWAGERRIAALATELALPHFAQHIAGDALVQGPGAVERFSGNQIDQPAARFALGAQSLALEVARRLAPGVVRLDCAVERVTADAAGVVVHVAGNALHAAQVVIALPPALALAQIEFDPALPESIAEIARRTPVWMGAMTKVVAHYPHPFWRDVGLAGAAFSHIGPLREIHDASGAQGTPAALFGFAPPLHLHAPTTSEHDAIAQLEALFGAQARDAVRVHVQDWRRERWTSPSGVETLDDYSTFGHATYARPTLFDRVHFAGTETAAVQPGHIEGALESAERVARTVIARHRERLDTV